MVCDFGVLDVKLYMETFDFSMSISGRDNLIYTLEFNTNFLLIHYTCYGVRLINEIYRHCWFMLYFNIILLF